MSDILKQLRAALEKATPGPWEIVSDAADGKDEAWCHWHRVGPLDLPGKEPRPDTELIALLRNHAPALLDEVDALRAKLDAATRERDFLVSEYERAVKCEPQGFTHAAAHIYNAIVNAKCDASAEHFMRLQGKLDAIHRYAADRADEDDGRLNGEAAIWQEFFDGKEPPDRK